MTRIKVLDWDKAACIIRSTPQAIVAEVGWHYHDFQHTNIIYENGLPRLNSYFNLCAGLNANPGVGEDYSCRTETIGLRLWDNQDYFYDRNVNLLTGMGMVIECWKWEDETPWSRTTQWPESALTILCTPRGKQFRLLELIHG